MLKGVLLVIYLNNSFKDFEDGGRKNDMKCYIPHYKPERLYMFKEAPREGHGFPPNILCGWVTLGKKGLGPFHQEGLCTWALEGSWMPPPAQLVCRSHWGRTAVIPLLSVTFVLVAWAQLSPHDSPGLSEVLRQQGTSQLSRGSLASIRVKSVQRG